MSPRPLPRSPSLEHLRKQAKSLLKAHKARNPGTRTYTPFLHWVSQDFSGKYINVKDGVRKTYLDPLAGSNPLTVYMLGGSTTFGTVARSGSATHG